MTSREIIWEASGPLRCVRVCFGSEIELRLEVGGKFFDVSLSVPFVVQRPGSEPAALIDPAAVSIDDVALLLGLRGSGLLSCTATSDGTLRLTDANGVVLIVEPRDDGEAWEIIGLDGEFVVALPGGEVAVWDS